MSESEQLVLRKEEELLASVLHFERTSGKLIFLIFQLKELNGGSSLQLAVEMALVTIVCVSVRKEDRPHMIKAW